MPGPSHATPRGQALGAALKKARKSTPGSPSVRDVAAALTVSAPTISRYESGGRLASPAMVQRLLDYYVGRGLVLDNETRDELDNLAHGRERAPWVAFTLPEQHRQLDTLLKFEQGAHTITNVSPLLIPGLCQTPDYTRVIMVRSGVPEDQIETRVAVRTGRGHALTRRVNPARLVAAIDETVLHRQVGGPRVMAEQLRHLLDLAERPNVELRVMPGNSDWYAALEGPFVLVEFSDRQPVVHLEIHDNGLFVHEEEDVARYSVRVQEVLRDAMSEADSVSLIARAAEQTEETIQ